MRARILKIQKSSSPIWKTKLSANGPISDRTLPDEQSYEMKVFVHNDGNTSEFPDSIIELSEEYYERIIPRYGMKALLDGVRLNSMMSLLEKSLVDSEQQLKREVDGLSHLIVGKFEQDALFNKYDPEKMRIYIRDKILSLRDNFNIEPK